MNFLKKQKIFDEEKIVYLPDPALNVKKINKLMRQKIDLHSDISKENSLISIGRLTNQKNQIFLIKNFANLINKYKNLNLFILGDGENKSVLQKEINRNNLNSKVFLLGYKKNIFPFLKNSKAFILTSLWEDPGFVLLEAAFANKIIISSNCPNGPEELMMGGKNGFLFKNNSSTDFLRIFDKFMMEDQKIINNKIINFKKICKHFTLYGHFKILREILI